VIVNFYLDFCLNDRLILELTVEAFTDAGIPLSSLASSPTGVFIAAGLSDYVQLQHNPASLLSTTPYTATSSSMSIIANRLSYVLDLRFYNVNIYII
jgi:acyl transferase domain-containing protein